MQQQICGSQPILWVTLRGARAAPETHREGMVQLALGPRVHYTTGVLGQLSGGPVVYREAGNIRGARARFVSFFAPPVLFWGAARETLKRGVVTLLRFQPFFLRGGCGPCAPPSWRGEIFVGFRPLVLSHSDQHVLSVVCGFAGWPTDLWFLSPPRSPRHCQSLYVCP